MKNIVEPKNAFLESVKEALNALRNGPKPAEASDWENIHFRIGWAISSLEKAVAEFEKEAL